MVRLLADENFPGPAVKLLRSKGLDLQWVAEFSSGMSDEDVIELAKKQNRIIITSDKDFGYLAFRQNKTGLLGIILCRIAGQAPTDFAQLLLSALRQRTDWATHFSVIERDKIRMRPL